MGIELWLLFLAALVYLGVLFLIAYAGENGYFPKRLIEHPAVYALSLGVYATSWTFYGSVGLADSSGLAFLTIYLGVTAAFALGPYLLAPVLRLCRDYQLSSIADLLAFRYGGRATGLCVTVFMLMGILPYISLQITAVTRSIQVLAREAAPNLLALAFCVVIIIFSVAFGARHLTSREKHSGLVLAIAFESAVKLVALLVAGLFAVYGVFGSVDSMHQWLADNPQELRAMYEPVNSSLWSTLLLLAFGAAFLLPRQYHMTFVENLKPNSLKTAYWMFPLYLLLLNLPIFPILWAGKQLALTNPPDFYVLGMAMSLENSWLSLLVYIGGLSAASAMMIVTTLSLSYMCLNHLLLPVSIAANNPDTNLYQRLVWSKRIIIASIIAAGYGFYLVIELHEGLASLGLISFVAAIQLLPGVIGLLFWTRATQTGFLAGLFGGALVWFFILILPLLTDSATIGSMERLTSSLGFSGVDVWSISTFCSLTVNCLLYIVGSLLTRVSTEESEAAQACVSDAARPLSGLVIARSTSDYIDQLEQLLGREASEQEVRRAVNELGFDESRMRTVDLRLLHERLERNLSGLLGPTVARLTLRGHLELNQPAHLALTESLRAMEMRLETSSEQMRGMTKELDNLRRYLRNVLHELPLGVCSFGPDGGILIWNQAMEDISGIDDKVARQSKLFELPVPWSKLLFEFAESDDDHIFKHLIELDSGNKSFNFHKAMVTAQTGSTGPAAGQVILVEDRTNLDLLESELAHSERLASIGRLAAGVAHEIGNPLTGIASIAQNQSAYPVARPGAGSAVLAASPQESAEDILTQVKRIDEIVKSLLAFARNEPLGLEERERIEISDCVHQAIQLVRLSESAKFVEFNTDFEDLQWVSGSERQMVQIFVNLLNNACDVSEPNGVVDIKGFSSEGVHVITVRDYGVGIKPEDQSRIFEPFYTTKSVGRGTGLGLSLVYSLVNEHGGKISIDPSKNKGACFEIRLPASPASQFSQAPGL